MNTDNKISVYVKVNENNIITAINSNIFISDTSGWTLVDSGNGDKYAHAQNLYLDKPIADRNGVYRYKLIDGKITERSAEEMAADIPEPAESTPTNAELAQQITDVQMALCEIYESLS